MIGTEVIGRKEFHLKEVVFDQGPGKARLEVLYRDDEHGTVDESVEYAIPDGFGEVVEAMAKECPMHMVGFQEQEGQVYLANAATVWGHVCPCAE